jgi:hypothetical protein
MNLIIHETQPTKEEPRKSRNARKDDAESRLARRPPAACGWLRGRGARGPLEARRLPAREEAAAVPVLFRAPKGRFALFAVQSLLWFGRCLPDHQVNGWLWRIGSQEMGLRIGGNQEDEFTTENTEN